MRIAFIVDTFPAIAETYILNQITGLMDLGHEVEIFAAWRPQDRDFHPEIARYKLLSHTFYHDDKPTNKFVRVIEAFFLLVFHFLDNPKAILNSLNFFKYKKPALALTLFYKVILFTTVGKFDIIHCHFGPNGQLGAILKELGIPGKLITMFHGYDIRNGIQQGGSIYNKLIEHCDLFLSISEYNYKHLLEFGVQKEKIISHPVGIHFDRFPFRLPSSTRDETKPIKILSIGKLTEEKGFTFGIKVIYNLIHEKNLADIEYHIIGDGPMRNVLIEFAEKNGLKDKVFFWGAQQRDGVVSLLASSDLFFLPSIAEALPVVLMEAQAVGLPVVATRVGSAHQVVKEGESAILVDSANIDAMTEALHALITNPQKWDDMAITGRKHVEKEYDITQLNKKLVTIYQQLLCSDSIAA